MQAASVFSFSQICLSPSAASVFSFSRICLLHLLTYSTFSFSRICLLHLLTYSTCSFSRICSYLNSISELRTQNSELSFLISALTLLGLLHRCRAVYIISRRSGRTLALHRRSVVALHHRNCSYLNLRSQQLHASYRSPSSVCIVSRRTPSPVTMSNNHSSKPRKTLLSYFGKKLDDQPSASTSPNTISSCSLHSSPQLDDFENDDTPSPAVLNTPYYERDPGLRLPIGAYPADKRDDVRKAYIKMGPLQLMMDKYPSISDGRQTRRFQSSWFKRYEWLEYSVKKNKAYCFACYLFDSVPSKYATFTIDGFQSWKRVNCGENGKNCPFVQHVGDHNSQHSLNMQSWRNLQDSSRHINKVMNMLSLKETSQNRLRLKTSLEAVKWLAMQGCAFRGHDESISSTNRGNFIELINLQGRVNEEIGGIVLENAPQNAKYTSPDIQKELLNILANRVRAKIREEIGDAKFCILVDESLDESNKEQMAIILRYVDLKGFVQERFFEVLSVKDTNALTLKNEILNVLTRYDLSLENLRGQGYDGASNMRGEWNGLQALFLRDCPCAYYIHCFAHRLQLALVAVAKEVHDIWLFFSKLTSIVNFVSGSFKRHSELKSIREAEIDELIAIGELESGTGANQMRTLQRPGATRWSSHYKAIGGLIKMFSSVSTLLEKLIDFGLNNNIRGEAKGAYKDLRSFDFVFILLLLHEILGISDLLCQALQLRSQDILNAMNLVSSTKLLLQELRESKWDSF